jgi:hypothetical protein
MEHNSLRESIERKCSIGIRGKNNISQNIHDYEPEQIDQPINLNIELYRHQKVSVHKMENLEKYKEIKIDNRTTIKTDFGILGDIPGYGKSYSIVSLILRDKMEWNINEEYKLDNIKVFNDSVKVLSTIKKTKTNTNILVCSISLMKQWKSYFDKAPSLKVYEISTKKHIDDYVNNKYDIIIVSSNRFNELTDFVGPNIIWKRFIFDEASNTSIPSMNKIYFGFMWLVTATYEHLFFIRGNSNNYLKNFFRTIPYDFLNFFLIKNNEKFIKESFEMPPVHTFMHQCINPRILTILRNHIDEETQIMISAGNIGGAIARLGGNIYTNNNLIDIVKIRKQEKIT